MTTQNQSTKIFDSTSLFENGLDTFNEISFPLTMSTLDQTMIYNIDASRLLAFCKWVNIEVSSVTFNDKKHYIFHYPLFGMVSHPVELTPRGCRYVYSKLCRMLEKDPGIEIGSTYILHYLWLSQITPNFEPDKVSCKDKFEVVPGLIDNEQYLIDIVNARASDNFDLLRTYTEEHPIKGELRDELYEYRDNRVNTMQEFLTFIDAN